MAGTDQPTRPSCRYCDGTGYPDHAGFAIDRCARCGGSGAGHPDDIAVDNFAEAMKSKLALARLKGRGGWQVAPEDYLARMLREHVVKGDMRDVANIAMMIHTNRERNADAE